MNEILRLFAPLVGKMAWGIHQTHGSCFLIEFGEPRLKSLGPLQVGTNASVEQIHRTRRRHAVLYGQWTLLIQDCAWKLQAWESVVNDSAPANDMRAPFEDLTGQFLESVRYDEADCSCIFEFDLGARLITTPGSDFNPDWVQWTLNTFEGHYTSLLNNGVISFKAGDVA
ncbi:hypothetical protein SAMN05192539_103082 [Paraburkholderia diazotrophica]|uniref:Uncharacterized protein n=1 Tax=Paraburkholderia diazotrophica TaxID=667676 RepID=A0A1H7DQT3_9BURK|nr:hypothetical protein SAMN05192539_103082 [Paraburkholderia diazotrophica]